MIKDALKSAELGADLTKRLMIFACRSNLNPVMSDLRVLGSKALNLLKRTLDAPYRIKAGFAAELDR